MAKAEVVYCEGQFPDGCGQKVMERPVVFDLSLLRILAFIARRYPMSVSAEEIRKWNAVAYTVVGRLQYFDVAEHGRPPDADPDSPALRGWWKATMKGIWFLTGEEVMYLKVWVYNHMVKRTQGQLLGIESVKGFTGDRYEFVVENWLPADPDQREVVHDDDDRAPDDDDPGDDSPRP